ncbi:MAG: hypothetical protein FJW39_05005 [Acidobacteria bacterium]|nr:hypothetical protein [Acidobacteriota bacterium]
MGIATDLAGASISLEHLTARVRRVDSIRTVTSTAGNGGLLTVPDGSPDGGRPLAAVGRFDPERGAVPVGKRAGARIQPISAGGKVKHGGRYRPTSCGPNRLAVSWVGAAS